MNRKCVICRLFRRRIVRSNFRLLTGFSSFLSMPLNRGKEARGYGQKSSHCISKMSLGNPDRPVFLDEPMSGLDPLWRRAVRSLILSLRDEGRTLFFTSHILADAEAICSRVAILSHGRLVASGKVADLDLKVRGWELVMAEVSPGWVVGLEPTVGSVTRVAEGRYVIEVPADRRPEPLIAELTARGARVISLTPHQQTLEEFFVDRVTGGRGDGDMEEPRPSA